MYETSGHFPYYRDSQFPPLFGHDAGQIGRCLDRTRLASKDNRSAADERSQVARGRRSARFRLEESTIPNRLDDESARRAAGLAKAAGAVSAQADELPAPRADVQGAAAELSRAAGAAGGIRHRVSPRAVGRTQRHAPRAGTDAGRCPPVLHPRSGRRGIPGHARTVQFVLKSVGSGRLPRAAFVARSGQRQVRRQRGTLEPG